MVENTLELSHRDAAGTMYRLNVVQVDKSVGHAVDPAYYQAKEKHIGPIHVHDRDCAGCINKKISCNIVSSNLSIVIELLAMEFTIDSEVSRPTLYNEAVVFMA